MLSWLKQNKTETVMLVFLSLLVNATSYIALTGHMPFENVVDGIAFFDPDDYMRLVRMNEWFSGKGFFDTTIERANSPFGGDMHWTRFYDLFWYIPVKIVEFFTKDVKSAVAYVGFVISPIFAIFSGLMFFRIMQYLMDRRDAFITSALFLGHAYIVIQTIFGRPDYHSFIIFVITLYILLLTKLLVDGCEKQRTTIATAVATALCIYASPETLIPLLLSEATLFVFSLKNDNILKCLMQKNKYTFVSLLLLYCLNNLKVENTCAIALGNMVCIMVLMFQENKTLLKKQLSYVLVLIVNLLCFLIFQEREDYDKLSLVHVNLYFNVAMFYGVYANYSTDALQKRIKIALIVGGIFFIMFLVVCPKFFLGMEANVDAYAKTVWLSKVEEMQSPLKGEFCCSFLIMALINVVASVSKIREIYRNKNVSRETIVWSLFVVIGLFYTVFGCIAFRMAPYAVMFMNPVVIDFVMNGRAFAKFSRIIRLLFVVTLILMVQIVPTYASREHSHRQQNNSAIDERALYKAIDFLSEKPATILASINVGPRLLWFTKHKIVAAPYHRHTNGIIAEYEILQNKFRAKTIKKCLLNTKTEYIVIDKAQYFCEKGEGGNNSFGYYIAKYADYNGWTKTDEELSKLVPAEIPKWVRIVPLEKIYRENVDNNVNNLRNIVVVKIVLDEE